MSCVIVIESVFMIYVLPTIDHEYVVRGQTAEIGCHEHCYSSASPDELSSVNFPLACFSNIIR